MKTNVFRAAGFGACFLLIVNIVGADNSQPHLKVMHPKISIAAPVAPVAGGFLMLTNEGEIADRLIGASASFADRVEIHQSIVDNGVMKMRRMAEGIVIDAGGTVELKHGGFHIMFMNLNHSLTIGEREKVELIFEKADPITVSFIVVDGSKHSGH